MCSFDTGVPGLGNVHFGDCSVVSEKVARTEHKNSVLLGIPAAELPLINNGKSFDLLLNIVGSALHKQIKHAPIELG